MARKHFLMKRSLLLGVLALLASTALAQDTTTDDTATAAATTVEATTTDTSDTTTEATTTSAAETTAATTATTATSDTGSVPALTSSATGTTTTAATGTDTGLPKLTSSGAYSYPAASVPPTSNAPYMQSSKLPEGTVFIAVGAILGAFGAAVLIWRAIVACLLHRSVKRAALAQHMANDKIGVPGAPPPIFYKYSDRDSSASLGGATGAAAGRGVRRTTRGPIPSATPSQSNLFFSPTATNVGNGAGNRSSTFLPAGFYAAGQGAPQQNHGHSISLTNLRPDSIARPSGHTPPDSPAVFTDPTRRHPHMSTSSLNLNQPPTGRAPSTYLEDLLDDQPGQFPPPQHNRTWSPSQNRF
ncbi:hypothetical protein BX600DRAFT_512353 [Xylariales sp. PMI_506]|nr:hypothetical protein BX600DRAFT_512353 [Xylariales sp. PMI_506]